MEAGNPGALGATVVDGGVNFAVWSSVAERVELCLFELDGRERRVDLPERDGHVWHGFLPNCEPGQRYGYRVHGAWDPAAGLRCNPAKLLLDPYAKLTDGNFEWHEAVFDYTFGNPDKVGTADSAPWVPKGVVVGDYDEPMRAAPNVGWRELAIYEANVRSLTMRHPAVPDVDRGRFLGVAADDVLRHIKSLGVTAIELMPVMSFVDEHHLYRRGLRNSWGYNTLSFFAPMLRYAGMNPRAEFRAMVNRIHDAGLEVILDVAYNHTCEGDGRGPTLSLRGFDNLAYYRTVAGNPGAYINDTGTGNTLDADSPVAQQLVIDSLRYWTLQMGVDGFRFDLAPVLGRHPDGFSREHPLLAAIADDSVVSRVKLIAEPWDPGPGGYQLGRFPPGWGEWNDQYRDTARRFWRGDHGVSGEMARRLHGSADIFDCDGRRPSASVNFVTAHDGFTLTDVVSYEHRHNEANGEDNRDGHAHNFSLNYRVEGPSDDPNVLRLRRWHRLNLLASLAFSQGTPMLLSGDELGRSQAGNNNAYAQDNALTWLDWQIEDEDFLDRVRRMFALRQSLDVLRPPQFVHGEHLEDGIRYAIAWLDQGGQPMPDHAWTDAPVFAVAHRAHRDGELTAFALVILNRNDAAADIQLPYDMALAPWRVGFVTHDEVSKLADDRISVPACSVAVICHSA